MSNTMSVPVFVGDGRLETQQRPIPTIQRDDDVLIEIEACGICGTCATGAFIGNICTCGVCGTCGTGGMPPRSSSLITDMGATPSVNCRTLLGMR